MGNRAVVQEHQELAIDGGIRKKGRCDRLGNISGKRIRMQDYSVENQEEGAAHGLVRFCF